MVKPGQSAVDVRSSLIRIYRACYDRFGHRHWWPADTPFEVIVGAILTQNTAWANVKLAISKLKEHGLMSPEKLRVLPREKLAMLIKPAGYYNQKSRYLQAFLEYLYSRYGGRVELMGETETARLRKELLDIKGIGPETADSILLYALGRPVFVVDNYTRRVFSRHGFFPPDSSYQEIQNFFESHLPEDVELYNDFHAQIVALGNRYCRAKPSCGDCPLAKFPHTTT